MVNKLSCKVNRKTVIYLGVFGVFFVCAGAYFGFKIIPDLIDEKIWEMKVLKNDTDQWGMFVKVPFPFTFKVYIFEIQNPLQILEGAKPIVKEKGPYIYKEFKYNTEIEWISSDRISYFANRRFYFDGEASNNWDDNDEVMILNTPYLNVLYKIQDTQPAALPMIAGALPSIFGENDGLFVKVKVKDYLFEGLKMCENGGNAGGFVAGMACKQIMAKVSDAPVMRIENNTILFANMYYKNTTPVGKYTIESGLGTKEETAVLKLFKRQEYITTWGKKSTCNKIRGVTTVFPVHINKGMIFESFSEDVCRTMALEFQRDEVIKEVSGYRFVAKNDTFNYTKPENACYCLNSTKTLANETVGCPNDGLMDLSTCTGI